MVDVLNTLHAFWLLLAALIIQCVPRFHRSAMELAPSAPPEPAEVEYHWTEVTEDFLTACKGTWKLFRE